MTFQINKYNSTLYALSAAWCGLIKITKSSILFLFYLHYSELFSPCCADNKIEYNLICEVIHSLKRIFWLVFSKTYAAQGLGELSNKRME